MTADQKKKVQDGKRSVAHAKSELLHIYSKLCDAGATRAADKLGAIIGRLEAWQNS
jgi:hypothetical protein